MSKVLCVDDEAASVLVLEDSLQRAGYKTVGVRNAEAALNVLARGGIDLVVTDYQMPDIDGLELMEIMGDKGYDVPVVMVTGHGSIEHAVTALKAGALDYITKPIRPAQLQLAVEQALEVVRLRRENAQLKEEVTQLRGTREIVGESPALERVLETISTVAPTRTTVLLQGESGTGKELVARKIHEMSDRRDGPFITVNCAAIPENLVESTLFGHEKGAFTGALKQVKGAFERAHGGSLLLDEVTEMDLEVQARFLRALQEQEFERVGGADTVEVDVRIIATTNRDLASFVEEGGFREDLYYRISVLPIRVPPLRERKGDIPILAQHFARRTALENGQPTPRLHPDTVELLQSYEWPGNVRELAHAVERAVILSEGDVLRPEAFERERFGLAGAEPVAGAPAGADEGSAGSGEPTPDESEAAAPRVVLNTLDLDEAEEVLIRRALERTGGNRTRAAELLGITARTLRNKLNRPSDD